MPSINRIRVNNVKYNFGTQFYDDFTMRMHGKNTLYDLANGGGKSVLMLLLLQNLIPNCTLDEKQPIEKLFRTGNGNTTIHSLVEWKLDAGDDSEGYKYMTTGFCARKAKEASEENETTTDDVASIEYFNYCIFYREYNKNDIINLPLVKDGVRTNYQSLKTYLKDLERSDMRLRVRVFERKGEYQRYISEYGLHESQWEIIRGINKTEGHVRTYFENNYKTTRKVVEDLLIEEIIEKAFMVKTARDENGNSSMAKMLMDIKEQLTVLAKKKKDIAGYDHQIELIRLLADKVGSFMDLYKERTELSDTLASICVTGAEFAKNDEEKMEKLLRARDEKRAMKEEQRKNIECLKVARDKNKVGELKEDAEKISEKLKTLEARLKYLEEDYSLKESINEYIEYMSDRSRYYQYDAVIKNMMSDSSFDEDLLYAYVYNIKMRMDIRLTEIRRQVNELAEEINEGRLKKEYQERLINEAETALAVNKSKRDAAKEEIVYLSEKLSKVRMAMNDIQLVDYKKQLEDNQAKLEELKQKSVDIRNGIEEDKEKLNSSKLQLMIDKEQKNAISAEIKKLEADKKKYDEAIGKLDSIKSIYKAENERELLDIISSKITQTILDCHTNEQEMELCNKRNSKLLEGRIIEVSEAAQKVLNYIETRHGTLAMSGMDYIMAIPKESKEKLLKANPELVYGVVVEEYDEIKDDPNIKSVDTGSQMVIIYDMKAIEDKSVYYGDHAFTIGVGADYVLDDETVNKLICDNDEKIKELKTKGEIKQEMLAALKQDQTFVISITENDLLKTGEKLEETKKELVEIEAAIEGTEGLIRRLRAHLEQLEKEIAENEQVYAESQEDNNRLLTVASLSDLIDKQEELQKEAVENIKRLDEKLIELKNDSSDDKKDYALMESKLEELKKQERKLEDEWEDNYKAYYNIDKDYDVLSTSDDELKARFKAMVEAGSADAKAIEDKKVLMDTISISMNRMLKSIERRGTSIDKLKEMEKHNQLFAVNEEVLIECRRGIDETKEQVKKYKNELDRNAQSVSRIEGSIEYAVKNIEAAFGSYEEKPATMSEIIASLEDGEQLLERIQAELKKCEDEYREYSKQQGYMLDLYKDVKRIVVSSDISLDKAEPLLESKDKLREIFEESLLKFDKSTKKLEKAKNELLKFKSNTAIALEEMEVYELAQTVRDEVSIPSDYDSANELLNNLNTTAEYIVLERDRIEKSLVDMETIKANFEEQCLQRCLDVRTELDKLPKLSRIIVDGEPIQMVGLSIPYVKDEFLKPRMSDYIDKIVAQADDYDKTEDRIRFIRSSLTLKKLFGVIVTDMNGIKLSLYKRERIKEQSRYLRYEEAVGSTGQSQGIYIQFLVAVINYISGMYQKGNEDIRTKTVFIDNPFGAAKDVYIWEPIFAMLKANRVQLIVPARGATPAITGRFDVNYILGQQMSGGKQLTVVTDYRSQVDQDELEYKELTYEQASFDFI